MRKIGLIALLLMAVGVTAYGQMEGTTFAVSIIGTNVGSKTYVLRGELEGVYIDVPTARTGTVVVATAQETLLSKASLTADVMYRPRVSTHTTAGANATFNTYSSTNALTANAQTWYSKAAMAGSVTVTVTGQSTHTAAAVWNVTLLYKK